MLYEGHGSFFEVEREDFCNGYPVYQGILVCTCCLARWARLSWKYCEAERLAGRVQGTYEVRGLLCMECFRIEGGGSLHPDLCPVPGSLLHNLTVNNWDEPLLEALPEALLRREFLLTMDSLCNPESEVSLKRGRMLRSGSWLPGQPIPSSSPDSGSQSQSPNPSGSPSSLPGSLSSEATSSEGSLTACGSGT